LIARSVDVNVRQSLSQNTALMIVAYKTSEHPNLNSNNIEIVSNLINHGAKLNLQNKDGNTALILSYGSYEMTQYLVSHGANVNLHNEIGDTALMVASKRNDLKMIIFLVEHGAKLNLQNKDGNTALIFSSGSYEITQYLVSHGANLELCCF